MVMAPVAWQPATRSSVRFSLRRMRLAPDPVSIQGTELKLVSHYKHSSVQLDNKLDWSGSMEAVYKRGQSSRLYLRRLRSFSTFKPLLRSLYKTAVGSALFFWCCVLGVVGG